MNQVKPVVIFSLGWISFGASVLTLTPTLPELNRFTGQPAVAQASDTPSGDLVKPLGQPTSPNDATASTTANLLKTSEQRQEFRYFVEAVRVAGLDRLLSDGGPYTVFAPTDQAFKALPPATLKALLRPENRDLLKQILKYHMIAGKVSFDALRNGPLLSVAGTNLFFQTSRGRVIVNSSRVVHPGLSASNGFIHGINQVLIPNSLRQRVQALTRVSSGLTRGVKSQGINSFTLQSIAVPSQRWDEKVTARGFVYRKSLTVQTGCYIK